MASDHQIRIQSSVGAIPPAVDVELVGWVLMAEWMEADGQKLLTRLASEHSSAWQVKGYLHEGLYTEWPLNPTHHNPGHSSGWDQISPLPEGGTPVLTERG